jgi:hypothetical protein
MNRLLFVAGAAAGFLATAGWSVLQSAPVKPAAADNTLGMALMHAVVISNGTLARGSGVLSAERNSLGFYFVSFDRSVVNCNHTATLGAPDATFTVPTGQLGVAGRPGFPNGVIVATHTSDGTNYADRSFHLMVFCPQ